MKKYIEVEASGEVGETYTSETGMHEANPYDHRIAWQQIYPTIRRQVGSQRNVGHSGLCFWKFCEVD